MKAITKLLEAKVTTADIAAALECTEHAVRNYIRGDRFPAPAKFAALVELGRANGIEFAAADFVQPPTPAGDKAA